MSDDEMFIAYLEKIPAHPSLTMAEWEWLLKLVRKGAKAPPVSPRAGSVE